MLLLECLLHPGLVTLSRLLGDDRRDYATCRLAFLAPLFSNCLRYLNLVPDPFLVLRRGFATPLRFGIVRIVNCAGRLRLYLLHRAIGAYLKILLKHPLQYLQRLA